MQLKSVVGGTDASLGDLDTCVNRIANSIGKDEEEKGDGKKKGT